MDWMLIEQVTGAVQNAVAALAVTIGGLWAYFRFVHFRTLKPRLEFSFNWSQSGTGRASLVAVLTVKLSNKGNTKVKLRKGDRHQCVLKYALVTADGETQDLSFVDRSPTEMQHLGKIFSAHKWIEPSETIDDVKVLLIDKPDALAVQFEVLIYGAQKWAAVAAFPLISGDASANSKSEDEQDDYIEEELIEELLGSCVADAKKLLGSRSASDDRSKIESALERGESLLIELRAGAAGAPPSQVLLRDAEKLVEELDRYCR